MITNMKTTKTFILFVLLFSQWCVGIQAQTSLFNGGHEDAPFGLTLGYVNKGWRTNMGGTVVRENLWGDKNKLMHGFQIGFNYQPCFDFGVGMHTGLFFEFYQSHAPSLLDLGYDRFEETNLYMPIHAMYRIPFTKHFSFSVFGGLGVNWAMYGSYQKYDRITGAELAVSLLTNGYFVPDPYRTQVWQQYGGGEWPRHFNLQWEIGGTLRYRWIQLGFTYSFGATNHHFYPGYLTRQDKMNVSLSFVTDL